MHSQITSAKHVLFIFLRLFVSSDKLWNFKKSLSWRGVSPLAGTRDLVIFSSQHEIPGEGGNANLGESTKRRVTNVS